MASYIRKIICNKEVYFKGNGKWTEEFSERKQYNTEADAKEAHFKYSGIVVNE
tara:strand:- start:337 stop:495 length:159 start_codon:yes stop_codon:yes gene_type:complete